MYKRQWQFDRQHIVIVCVPCICLPDITVAYTL